MAKSYSVTSAGVSPADDRAHRMRMYFFAMALRVLCVVSLFWVRGWWVLLVAAGAVLLPWFAVLVGNAVAHNAGDAPDAPEPQQLTAPATQAAEADAAVELIVIDVEPTRRSTAPPQESGSGGGFESGVGPGSGSESPSGSGPGSRSAAPEDGQL